MAVTLADCQQALRVRSPVHVMAEVRGIMSAQRAHCSLSPSVSLIFTHSLAPLFTLYDALEQCHDPASSDPIGGKQVKQDR